MTYDEAINWLLAHGPIDVGRNGAEARERWEEILDAIGFPQLRMDMEASWNTADHALKEKARAEDSALTWAARCEKLKKDYDNACIELAQKSEALERILELAERSDSHPELLIADIAREALGK